MDPQRSSKKIISVLCKAEANLDKFWNHVDSILNSIASNYQQGVLQRLLNDGGKMRRTIPWSKRERKQNATQVSVKDVYEYAYEPFFSTFHDTSTEITGNFDKSSIVAKSKGKTRGAPATTEEQDEPNREPSPEPVISCEVGKKAYKAYRAIFHTPGESPAAAMDWIDVVSALTDVGFSAEQLHVSQWQSNPVANQVVGMNLGPGISLHAPHSGSEVPVELARYYGKRLNRAYGWDGTMFTED